MSKYAPANAEGQKPYVVTGNNWGKEVSCLVYADSTADARYASGYRGTGVYVTGCRRATPTDIESQG